MRSQTGSGDATLIAGVVLKGSVAKSVVVRGVSSTLPAMGVSGALTDPFLTLYQGTSRMGSNDNWGGGPSLLQAFSWRRWRVIPSTPHSLPPWPPESIRRH